MAISFFVTDSGDFYADMKRTSLDEGTYRWLSSNGIDLGRRESFTVTRESPMFDTISNAEKWLEENWFAGAAERFEENINSASDPTVETYQDCARVAHELNEVVASSKLGEILPLENDHSYLCQVGVWYWSLGHKMLATMAYERSLEIQPEAPTYFNLAVCCDDMGQQDRANAAMEGFYRIVSSTDERKVAEKTLRGNGKKHLIR